MTILASEVKFYYTNGNTTSNPGTGTSAAGSLGGRRGAEIPVQAGADMLSTLFDELTGIQTRDGHVDFRCIAIRNIDPALEFRRVVAYIEPDDNPSPGDSTAGGADADRSSVDAIRAWLDPAAAGTDDASGSNHPAALTIANENTAPAGSSANPSGIISTADPNDLPNTGGVIGNFSNPTSEDDAISIGTLAPGAYRFMWFLRLTPRNTPARASQRFTLTIQGDSPAAG